MNLPQSTLLTFFYPPELGAAPTRLKQWVELLDERSGGVSVITGLPTYPAGRFPKGMLERPFLRQTKDGVSTLRLLTFPYAGIAAIRLISMILFTLQCLPVVLFRRRQALIVNAVPIILLAPALLARKLRGGTVIAVVSDLWSDAVSTDSNNRLLRHLFARLESILLPRADRVVTMTHGIARQLIEEAGVPEERIKVLPNGLMLSEWQRFSQLEWRRDNVLLYFGNIGRVYDFDLLFDAIKQCLQQDPRLILRIVGSGSRHSGLAKKAEALGIRKSVELFEPIPKDELHTVLNGVFASVLPLAKVENRESMRPARIPVLLAAGIPMIIAGECEGGAVIRDTDSGLLVDDQVDELAKAILELKGAPKRCQTMAENGRAYTRHHTILDEKLLEALSVAQ
ncbi:glycosyltransferase family 4 protein [Gammaproteobacteria bacterium]|nr:glycosyltransferase family 4 protein [Gammaproteobacteria bacterium]